MKLGVLDIGTNSIHVVIAEVRDEMQFEIVGRGKDMTRLGDETLKSGWLPPRKMDQAVRVVRQFVQLARSRGVNKLIPIATAAVREAANGGEFVERLRREAGIKVRTITGEEEARLIYLAVRHFVDLSKRNALIIDIGGGSAEFIVGGSQVMMIGRCLKLGSARLRDLFVSAQPVPKSDHERIHRHIEGAMKATLEEIRSAGFERVVATSGTAINLGSIIHEERTGRPLTNPLGFSYTIDELKDLHKKLARADRKELAELKGVDPERQDLLLPGACLLLHVLKETGRDEVTLCDRAIREGVILDYIMKNPRGIQAEHEIPNVRMRSVMALAQRCEVDLLHGRTVAKLALQIFDGLPMPGGLRTNSRELLEYASLLHDIGYHVSFSKHHKHAYYLIKNSELPGFTPEEVEIVASVARYHRKRPPKMKDPNLAALDARDVKTVMALSAILRTSDALDRSHFGVVSDLKIQNGARTVRVFLVAREDPAMEVWAANQRKRLLEKMLHKEILIEWEASRKGANGTRPRRAAAKS